MSNQPGSGVISTKQTKRKTARVDASYIFAADFGANAPQYIYAVSFEQFLEHYLPTIEVCGVKINLDRECPPTPFHILRKITGKRGSTVQKLRELKARIESASDTEVLEIMGLIRQLKLSEGDASQPDTDDVGDEADLS